MSFNKEMKRVMDVCSRMEQDGYDMDSVAATRLRLLLEEPDGPCLSALEAYYASGRRPLLACRGVSTTALIQRMDMEYPSAVSTILWLTQKPEEALDALRYYSNGEVGGEAT